MDSRTYILLINRKKQLEDILQILSNYTIEGVCQELGEINYQLFPTEKEVNVP